MDATEVRELAALTIPDRLVPSKHACPVDGCGLSAEEHHALGDGTLELMREVKRLTALLERPDDGAHVAAFSCSCGATRPEDCKVGA